MKKGKKNTLLGVALGVIIIGFILGLNFWNLHSRMEREAYDSATLYDRFRVYAEHEYGGYGRLPYAIMKEEGPVLVYFAYASWDEEGCYEIYTLSEKYADNHLWKGPVEEGVLTLEERKKEIDIDIRKKGTYRIIITVSENGKSEVEIEQIS